ncbi:hypothetical protein CEP54_014799 [Fusarium duplospermum]|uniref:Uncharacterized protein n=1 Tax=Fusarium duplospermum TaxID=1325734 RepID=A0A428NTL2_9HYPO|nr:hypothetical protein CEP54_014799 [Fusarium duplospermum]
MSWTKCRNSGWTPQKQTSDSIAWDLAPRKDTPIDLDQLMCSTRLSDSPPDPNASESTTKVLKTNGTFHFSGFLVWNDVAPGMNPRMLQHPQSTASQRTQFFGSRMNGDRVYPIQATYTYDAQGQHLRHQMAK